MRVNLYWRPERVEAYSHRSPLITAVLQATRGRDRQVSHCPVVLFCMIQVFFTQSPLISIHRFSPLCTLGLGGATSSTNRICVMYISITNPVRQLDRSTLKSRIETPSGQHLQVSVDSTAKQLSFQMRRREGEYGEEDQKEEVTHNVVYNSFL